ncbi:immunoglobulin superfamily member 1-like isoform X2 [Poecile atricapillus]|uniref:immunoglobulin superfamily member 1-like isoform X2 n=1 Tax=Poecile atricapillus TaxID=48891 RepID=UPI002738B230|nr:immunoglobulin superfamily member 1-like isoform X2 [Poecile atricapillus]
MLPVTHVLAFGAWLVAQSEVTLSEYLEEVDGEFGHISGPTHLSGLFHSPLEQNSPLCGDRAWWQPWVHSRAAAGGSLPVWRHLSPCAGAPTISIFLKPPGVIPLGGSTTICCICQHSSGSFVLYKGSRRLRTQSGSRAEFSISNATSQDSGTYNCHYLQGGTVLARSEELEVFVEELRLPRPHLSVLPGHEVTAGADVMFCCSPTHPSTGCYLYLEGQIRAQLLSRERGDYNLSHVQNGDSGRYSCQCYTINASREWSAVSNTLDLVVRDYTLCNTVRLALAAALLLLLLLLLLLGPLTAGAARSHSWRSHS